MSGAPSYQRRISDDEIDELLEQLPALAIEGPKGVGKTSTALQRARTQYALDDPATREVAEADPTRLLRGDRPVLIDEWQHVPETWDLIRRAVDAGAGPASFLLAGSAAPNPPPTHSGAGRIATIRLRPLSYAERQPQTSVSLARLLTGQRGPVAGDTAATVTDYTEEILASGFPAIRRLEGRARRQLLEGYLERIVDRDIPGEAPINVRNPAALRRWMTAYAAASSTTASFEALRDAATAGHADKPSRTATNSYRDALSRVWVLDEVPAWVPTHNRLNELGHGPKHQLADPALAAQLLGVQASTLLRGGPPLPRDGTLLGALFESLATLSIRVYAAHNEARVKHLRTARGRQEVDLIVERPDGAIVAIEVKLSRSVTDRDGKHLRWLEERIGDQLLDRVIVTTGPSAYRRPDGIAVAPLALLGP